MNPHLGGDLGGQEMEHEESTEQVGGEGEIDASRVISNHLQRTGLDGPLVDAAAIHREDKTFNYKR